MTSDLKLDVDKFIINFKTDLFYTEDHIWIKKEKQKFILGLTDFGQLRSGDIVFFQFLIKGGFLREQGIIAVYETIKATLDVITPIDSEILEINSQLEKQTELINKDPYGEGWIVKLKPIDIKCLNMLLTPNNYYKLVKETIKQTEDR